MLRNAGEVVLQEELDKVCWFVAQISSRGQAANIAELSTKSKDMGSAEIILADIVCKEDGLEIILF